jgi:hypothetical protein
MDLRNAETRLTAIHNAIRDAKAAGMDRTDPHRFAFMSNQYWTLRRMIADRDER